MTEGVCHPVPVKYVPASFQAFQTAAFFQCRIEQFPSVFPLERKGEEQYEHQQFHLDILLNILSASSSVFCSCRLLNTSSAPRSDLFLSLYRKCRPPFLSWISMMSLFLSGMVNLFMATVNVRLSCAGISSG